MEKYCYKTHILHSFKRKFFRFSCRFSFFRFLLMIVLFCGLYDIRNHHVFRSNKDQLITYCGVNSPRNYEFNTIENDFIIDKSRHSIFKLNFSARADSEVSSDVVNDSRTDLILIWTYFYDFQFLYDPIEDMDRHIYSRNRTLHRPAFCENVYPNCVLTADRKYFNRSDLLVFHLPDVNMNDVPAVHPVDQIWSLYSIESPNYSFRPLPRTVTVSFNATSSYHSQSDMPIPYGETIRSRNDSYAPQIGDKKFPILWLSSNCFVKSKREIYIALLNKYIAVKIVGKCSLADAHLCSKRQFEECHKQLYREHYFYLAFENSFCEEYATEKIFMSLQHDIVPIVYGAASYSQILPPHSFIDATKYKPKDLAAFVQSLIANQTAYLEYFHWKREYRSRSGNRKANDYFLCEACRYVQRWKRGEVARKSLTLRQIDDYWKSTCWPDSKVESLLIE